MLPLMLEIVVAHDGAFDDIERIERSPQAEPTQAAADEGLVHGQLLDRAPSPLSEEQPRAFKHHEERAASQQIS